MSPFPNEQAKESAAKENLRLLRNVIELYAAQHKGVPPGYPNGDITKTPAVSTLMLQLMKATNLDGAVTSAGTAGSLGPYLSKLPENPLNGRITIMVINTIPAEATDITGWIYKPLTKTIKLNAPGKDSQGVRYYDY